MATDLPPPNDLPVDSTEAPRKEIVRWIVSIHIIGIAGWLMCVLADRGLLVNEGISSFIENVGQFPFVVCCLPIDLCPLWLLVEIVRWRVTGRSAVLAVIAETLLTWTHLQVLLPAVGEYGP